MKKHRARAALAAAHHIKIPITIKIDKHRVLRRRYLAHLSKRPRLFGFIGAGMEVGANYPAFLPAGGNVKKPIIIYVF